MRCPDCSKFVSFDTDTEPEVDATEVDDEGHVTFDARIVNNCAECGTELTEYTFNVEVDLTDAVGAHQTEALDEAAQVADQAKVDGKPAPEAEKHNDLKVEVECDRNDRRETETVTVAKRGPKKGQTVKKPIPFRYQKQFYGVSGTVTVTCACGEEFAADFSDDVQASGMDEMV